MDFKQLLIAPLVAVVVFLAGCGCGGSELCGRAPEAQGFPCSERQIQQFVFDRMKEWYLFPESIPADASVDRFATAEELLTYMTAPARTLQKDRAFSELLRISVEERIFGDGQSLGFGFTLRTQTQTARLFVAQVFEGSAAAAAGFVRGDEITAIGEGAAALEPVSGILTRAGGLTSALGPLEAGVARTFRVTAHGGAVVERVVAKRLFATNSVAASRVIEPPGRDPVGYVHLRSFETSTEAGLRQAFASFKARNVRDVVIDLRYNGGGLLVAADVLLDMLASTRAGQLSYESRYTVNKTASNTRTVFRAQPEAIDAHRVAFITTDITASASEAVISALSPYTEIAVIGGRTFGKPVAQDAFDLGNCDLRLRPVTYATYNRDGAGEYYSGIPYAGFRGDFCASAETFTSPLGADADPLLTTAVTWLAAGDCPVSASSAPKQFTRPPEAEGKSEFSGLGATY
jgi:carboxyl-terminal processing protease